MGDHGFDGFPGRSQILTGIEVTGVLREVFADGCRHGQTQVRINVDFADTESSRFQQHVFRNALGSVQFAAVLVAFFYERRNDGRSAMQYQRVTGQHVGDLLQTGEIQFRFAFKFVGAMAGADGNSQAVAAGTFHKFYGLIRIRVGGVLGSNLYGIFHAG